MPVLAQFIQITLHQLKMDDQTALFLREITGRLNDFFAQISSRNYEFENISESKKLQQSKRQKLLRKAYRIFKKCAKRPDLEDMSQKEKERAYTREWDQMEEAEKMKYLKVGKVAEKKPRKKKDDEVFKPGIDN